MSHDNATDKQRYYSYCTSENRAKILPPIQQWLSLCNNVNYCLKAHTVNLLRVEEFHDRTGFRVGLGCSGLVEGKGHTPRAGECSFPVNSNVKHRTSQLNMKSVHNFRLHRIEKSY